MTVQPASPGPLTILCVDDESYVLTALQRLLRPQGHRVMISHGASEALEILAQERFDLVICDEAMPRMRGIEFLKKVRESSPHTLLVLLTAYCYAEDVVIPAVNECEVFRMLSKPWEDAEVLQVVAEAADRRAARVGPGLHLESMDGQSRAGVIGSGI